MIEAVAIVETTEAVGTAETNRLSKGAVWLVGEGGK